jgi:hypothetical protein
LVKKSSLLEGITKADYATAGADMNAQQVSGFDEPHPDSARLTSIFLGDFIFI